MGKCWQIAAGSAGRDYVDRFLKHGMAFVGGSDQCKTMVGVEPGDRVILKRGMSEIVAVGEVATRNDVARGDAAEAELLGDNSKAWLRDFDGWDLQAWCYVDWRLPPGGSVKTEGLTRATIQQVWKQHLLDVAEEAIREWSPYHERIAEPGSTLLVNDDTILDFLIKEGLRPGDAENLTAALARVRRLSQCYYNEVEWDQVREHETRTFLVVPLLLALGWAEQQLKIEQPVSAGEQRGRVDVCAFRKPFRGKGEDKCVMLIETKGLGQGLHYAPEQAKTYAKAFPECRVLLITNGHCFKAFEREGDVFPKELTACLNLRQPRDHYPLDPTKGGYLETLRLLLPTTHA